MVFYRNISRNRSNVPSIRTRNSTFLLKNKLFPYIIRGDDSLCAIYYRHQFVSVLLNKSDIHHKNGDIRIDSAANRKFD